MIDLSRDLRATWIVEIHSKDPTAHIVGVPTVKMMDAG